MKKIHESMIEEEHRVSPKGNFELFRKHISIALGGMPDVGEWGGGQPFDVECARLPSGKKNFPYHAHAAQTEYFLIVSGCGILKSEKGDTLIAPGDHIICLPGEAHQIQNTGDTDLVFYVIATHQRADITTYPMTGKKHLKPDCKVGEITEVDYYHGEE